MVNSSFGLEVPLTSFSVQIVKHCVTDFSVTWRKKSIFVQCSWISEKESRRPTEGAFWCTCSNCRIYCVHWRNYAWNFSFETSLCDEVKKLKVKYRNTWTVAGIFFPNFLVLRIRIFFNLFDRSKYCLNVIALLISRSLSLTYKKWMSSDFRLWVNNQLTCFQTNSCGKLINADNTHAASNIRGMRCLPTVFTITGQRRA